MTTRTSFYRSVFKRRTTALVPTYHRTPAHLDRQRIRRIIVSDLHLSNGTRYEENLVGNTFSEFLSIYINHSEPIELVLAGDTFELLQVFPGGIDGTAWSEDLAVRRMQIVFAYHTTVLVSLRSFLAAPQHRLVILIGNHDFELHYHGVQLYIAAALGLAPGDERLCFATSYRGPGFALVHGNQFEPWDGFTYFAGITAPFEVVRGTQLVREVLNPIKLDPLEFAPLLEHTCPHTHFLQHLLSPAQRRNPGCMALSEPHTLLFAAGAAAQAAALCARQPCRCPHRPADHAAYLHPCRLVTLVYRTGCRGYSAHCRPARIPRYSGVCLWAHSSGR
ncbi:MAG: hypothetical protein HC876_02610 [Chloroflexaceae bacterium]|nr:hypothetical protein [Chloroflexaceae bacterium]